MPSATTAKRAPASAQAHIIPARGKTTLAGTTASGKGINGQLSAGKANNVIAPNPKPNPQEPKVADKIPTFVGTVVGTTKPLLVKNSPTKAINNLKSASIGLWALRNTSSKAPESAEALGVTNGHPSVSDETVFGSDDRKKVSKKDFGPGGKYYSIVKLFMSYETKAGALRTFIGTGWLIAADIIVTAGHCAYDWEHHLGQAVEIKAYIGYNGRESVGSPGVQFRKGVYVATTAEWLKSGEAHHDVSFIKTLTPFTGVTTFQYVDTPVSGQATLGVVGFPGDLDRGENMYECFIPVKYDIRKGKGMLQYKIDTFGGNSGAPVLQQQDGAAIGVHVMGGAVNQASLIGALGNSFPLFVQALLFKSVKLAKSPLEVSIVEMKPKLSSPDEAFQADPNGAAESYDEAAEDVEQPDPSTKAYRFRELFTKALAFTMNADDRLSAQGLPASFGPSGANAAVFGHSLVQYVAQRAKTSGESILANGASGESGAEADEAGIIQEDGALATGLLSHGVLCEAALEALLTLDPATLSREKVFDKLATHSTESSEQESSLWNKPLTTTGTVGNYLTTFACSVAASVASGAINSLFHKKSKESAEGEDDPSYQPNRQPASGKKNHATDLLGALQAHASKQAEDQELFTRLIAPKAPTLDEALSVISDGLPPSGEATEAADENTLADGLKSRMLLGQAALKTLQQLPSEVTHSESFLSKLWNGVKSVGKAALQVAPSIILSAAGGKIFDAVKTAKFLRKESEEEDGEAGGENGVDEAEQGQNANGGDEDGEAGDEADEAGDEAGEADPEEAAMESFQDWYNSRAGAAKFQD